MRDRADFIENIQTVHTHLLILLDDIKYPLSEQHQKFLEVSEKAIGMIIHEMMKEDIRAVLTEVSRQQQEETGLFAERPDVPGKD